MNYVSEIKIKGSGLGKPNPMADIKNNKYIHARFNLDASLDENDKKYIGHGMISTLLPYMIQDDYNREKKEMTISTVVLENENLKAVFLNEYGGRLWSLYDKNAGIDLLYTNSVIQPCNFALRNAWIAGGVEFNIGIKGHSPLTCSPMFCELVGDDSVRFFEYERKRGVSYSITATLPKNSFALYIKVCIENTSDKTIPMYWWSNIAFPEMPNTRVIVPTNEAIHCSYMCDHYNVEKVKIPYNKEGNDVSYSLNLPFAADYFYKIPKDEKKWIAAVNPDGHGLLHYSTPVLSGRKLFLWGNSVGGRHWNEFLSEKGQAYIEIQAGLATTQLEHIPMAAGETWEWIEGYTGLNGNDKEFYGDWQTAIHTVEKHANEKIINNKIKAVENLKDICFDGDKKLVFKGSDWGALENEVRMAEGKEPISKYINYVRVDNEETKAWRYLLENGILPCPNPSIPPTSYVASKFWEKKIEDSFKKENGEHWYSQLQLGVIKYALGDINGAKKAWERSIHLTPSIWAYRNYAMLLKNEYGNIDIAIQYMQTAYSLESAKNIISFLREYADILTMNGKDIEWVKAYKNLPENMAKNERLTMYYAIALLHLGFLREAAKIITPDFTLSDIKEGEFSLSCIWTEIYKAILIKEEKMSEEEAVKLVAEKYPVPDSLNFKMNK